MKRFAFPLSLLYIGLIFGASVFSGSPAASFADDSASAEDPHRYEVVLPTEKREFPEPRAEGALPAFKWRGTKGFAWTAEQYMEEIPVLAELKMNFLMNCYLSLFERAPGATNPWEWENHWERPLSDEMKAQYAAVFRKAREYGIEFCFDVHPQFHAPRPLDLRSEADFEVFARHYLWAQSEGVRWFALTLDDVGWGKNGPAEGARDQLRLANYLFAKLRENDPGAQLIFCPAPYWGDGTKPDDRAYLETLAEELAPEIYLFWTGDEVIGARMTKESAESFRGIAKRRIFIWENFGTNDAAPALFLGPLTGRDPELSQIAEGFMCNPMHTQNQGNRLTLATCADYAWNP
ncbi:MAG: beta-N-acetylglucosaminidase domain-containing protein, partial [Thermoguttaceae bacterium]|nr:beta-N-acetylglucosaminidase domain-containing protein [Thermoguttaceae bacterium]